MRQHEEGTPLMRRLLSPTSGRSMKASCEKASTQVQEASAKVRDAVAAEATAKQRSRGTPERESIAAGWLEGPTLG